MAPLLEPPTEADFEVASEILEQVLTDAEATTEERAEWEAAESSLADWVE